MSDLPPGRVAIVTGAGRGIGRAIAESLVAEGARVVVADNGTSISGAGSDPEVARAAARELNDKAGDKRALAFPESVASPGVARQLVDLAVKTFGGIDIIVNNAAIRRDAPVFDADPADWDAVIRTNLSAAFHLTSTASGVMRNRGKAGRIVNIVSSVGLSGAPGHAAYASAKAGLLALTRVTAMDLADEEITANAVLPLAGSQPADVASLVTALCLPAGGPITGRLLGVRGREVFLFGEPQPVASFDAGEPGRLVGDIAGRLGGQVASPFVF